MVEAATTAMVQLCCGGGVNGGGNNGSGNCSSSDGEYGCAAVVAARLGCGGGNGNGSVRG